MLIQVFVLIASMMTLFFGAELALEAAERIGRFFGFSPLVIGLLLIGFGTSLPEFFVSHLACLKGEPEIALGNIVGSNLANLFLIMGVAGLFSSLPLLKSEIKTQLLLHLAITALLTGVLLYLGIGPLSFALLAIFFGYYLWLTFHQMTKQPEFDQQREGSISELGAMIVIKLVFGFVLLYFGGEYLVSSGTALATMMGISPYVISAIFVAFGTSFPELVTALIASYRGKDTALITGNILGSNIFNVAFVMGSLGFYEVPIKTNFYVEMGALWMASFFLLALYWLKKNFTRFSGIVFLIAYGYMVFHWMS